MLPLTSLFIQRRNEQKATSEQLVTGSPCPEVASNFPEGDDDSSSDSTVSDDLELFEMISDTDSEFDSDTEEVDDDEDEDGDFIMTDHATTSFKDKIAGISKDVSVFFDEKAQIPKSIKNFKIVHENSEVEKILNPIELIKDCYANKLNVKTGSFTSFQILLLISFLFFFFRLSAVQMQAVITILNFIMAIFLPRWKTVLHQTFDKNMKTCFVCGDCKVIYVCTTKHQHFKCPEKSCGCDVSANCFHYSSLLDYLQANSKDESFWKATKYHTTCCKKWNFFKLHGWFGVQKLQKKVFQSSRATKHLSSCVYLQHRWFSG